MRISLTSPGLAAGINSLASGEGAVEDVPAHAGGAVDAHAASYGGQRKSSRTGENTSSTAVGSGQCA